MKIKTSQGIITGGEIFNLVSHGWFIGILTFMFPLFALGTLGSLLIGELSLSLFFLMIFMVPLVIGIQALMFGGIVLLGLTIFPPGRRGAAP